MPAEGRYAVDRTRVMNHRNKMWQLGRDVSLVSIGGIDAQLSAVAGAVAAASLIVLVPVGAVLGQLWITAAVGFLLVFAIAYFAANHKFGSDESPFQWVRLQWARRFKNPDLIAGGGADKNPGELRWVGIVWRPVWARLDLNQPIKRPVYDPRPVTRDTFVLRKRPPRITFEQLLTSTAADTIEKDR